MKASETTRGETTKERESGRSGGEREKRQKLPGLGAVAIKQILYRHQNGIEGTGKQTQF